MYNIHSNRDNCFTRVKTLLENVPYLRDNKRDMIEQYRFYYKSDTTSEETICRVWRLVQQKFHSLHGEKWSERQAHAGKIRGKFRNLGQFESVGQDVSDIFKRKQEAQKENWFTKLFNF